MSGPQNTVGDDANSEDTRTDQARIWDLWAQGFDEWHAQADPTLATEFLLGLTSCGAVLELGVGTGRVALELARSGRQVTGVEISPMMLKELERKRGNLDVEVVLGSVVDFSLDRTFDLVYCVYSTLWCLRSQEEQVACIANAARHLSRGGLLVVEAGVPTAGLLGSHRQLGLRDAQEDSIRLSTSSINRVTQVVSFREITLRPEGTEILPVEGRYCFPSELDLMARLAGLSLEARYSDYAGSEFDSSSTLHVSVYRQP